jgi:hypothetical protein
MLVLRNSHIDFKMIRFGANGATSPRHKAAKVSTKDGRLLQSPNCIENYIVISMT